MSMTAWEATGRVREAKPNCSGDSALGFINKRVRNVIDTRSWSDLLRIGNIAIPQAYITGTVTLAPGSTMVTGNATAWPVHDAVNTTLLEDIRDPGVVEIKLASYINLITLQPIRKGQFLLLEQENASVTEVVTVLEVQVDKILASVRYQHAAGATVQSSSLTNLQFKAPYPVYTIKSVRSATSLELDSVFGGPTFTNVSYQIYMAYVIIGPNVRKLMYAWDPIQGIPLGTKKGVAYINGSDPQRTATDDPQELVQTIPDAGGNMQWEMWPGQMSPRTISVIYYDGWPPLRQDNDMLPFFINPEIFIAGAISDALRTRSIPAYGKTDPYFDIQLAQTFEAEYNQLLETGTQSDDNRFLKTLEDYQAQLGTSTSYLQSHVGPPGYGWPSDYN